MAQLMSDGEGGTNSIFLTDGAAPVLITHSPQLCKPYKGHVHTQMHINTLQTQLFINKKKTLLHEC